MKKAVTNLYLTKVLLIVGISSGIILAPTVIYAGHANAVQINNSSKIHTINVEIKKYQRQLKKAKTKAVKKKLLSKINRLNKQVKQLKKDELKSNQSTTSAASSSSLQSSATSSDQLSVQASSQATSSVAQTESPDKQTYGFDFVNSNSIAPQSSFDPGNPDQLKVGDGAWLFSDNNLAIYTNLPDSEQPTSGTISNPNQYDHHLMYISDIQTNASQVKYAHIIDVSNPKQKVDVGWVILSQLRTAVSNANDLIRPTLSGSDIEAAISEVKRGAVESLNLIRVQHGLSVLVEDSDLTRVAQNRSKDIISSFSHYDSLGNPIAQQTEVAMGILGNNNRYNTDGENISIELNSKDFSNYMIGYQSNYSMTYADAGDSNWEHRENILSSNYSNYGIGVSYDAASNEFYIAYEFAGLN
ncbi:CAP domain-containing protein [Nicoliella lavandulae]|uniref:CAP domain-containing protein n=1 Tax=Nicoliella lavandulae TaxID=3082954 RepID=A0ABU8SMZ1_9LACO